MNNIKIHLLDSDPVLLSQAKLIKKETVSAVKIISKLIPINDVDIIVMHAPDHIAYGMISGQTDGIHKVIIALEVKHKHFNRDLRTGLRRALAHELFHTVRSKKIGYPKTLLENFIDEGLANHFEIEIAGGKPPSYLRSLKSDALSKIILKAKKELLSTHYNYEDWFHGSSKRNIPQHSGYIIGYFFIKKFFDLNPNFVPSKLVQKKASHILKASKNFF